MPASSIFYQHSKGFPGADVTAIVEYETGVPVGYMEGWEDQKITGCFFLAGTYKANAHAWNAEKLKLGEVSPVAVSEVIKDLTMLASKGK
jgi:hypothetical protein